MYFVDMMNFDYQLPNKTHIIDRDRKVIVEEFTKIYKPNYEKYIHVTQSDKVQTYAPYKKTLTLDDSKKKKVLNDSKKKKVLNDSKKIEKKDCDCSQTKTDAKDVINKIISKNYLPLKFDENSTSLNDEQKKGLLNLNYSDANKINIISYSDLNTLKNDVVDITSKRAESILSVLPLDTKGKTIIDNRDCKEVVEKCGTVEIRLSY